MAAYALEIAWNGGSLDDRRFRRILLITAVVFMMLSVIIARLPVTRIDRQVVDEVPKRIARLVLEKRRPKPPPPPPPKIEEKKPEPKPEQKKPEPKPEPKPKPEAKPKPSARERASRTGILAFQDTLAELRQDSAIAKLESSKRLSSAGQTARKTERSLVTSKVGRGSGGINTAALSRDTGDTRLATHSVEQVKSPVKSATASGSRSNGKDKLGGRTDEEIRLVFDRNKSAIYNLYNRALRANPSLKGKMVVRLTIAPSGAVTDIKVVSSELGDDALERKLTLRIKRFDFGAKAVAATTISYTMDFFPS